MEPQLDFSYFDKKPDTYDRNETERALRRMLKTISYNY